MSQGGTVTKVSIKDSLRVAHLLQLDNLCILSRAKICFFLFLASMYSLFLLEVSSGAICISNMFVFRVMDVKAMLTINVQ
jgi:hypothetical protein